MVILTIFLAVVLTYLTFATLYLLALAFSYVVLKDPEPGSDAPLNRFAVLVPAHNEELLIANLCGSLSEINYPRELFDIHVIADNCSDQTAAVCREFPVTVLERNDPANRGKGQALDWGLKNIDLARYDAVFMVDADNIVDAMILRELNRLLNRGHQAIQCHNAVGNRGDSWFTELLYVSRTISNHLYHQAKFKLGLSSFLMGNGLCFKSELLSRRGWTAFSSGEDWEYYALLIRDDIKVGFASGAKVFHQESRSLEQATSQRLRWSRGKFMIACSLGIPLLLKGIKERRWTVIDASFPLILPNYSLQINLTFLAFSISLLLPPSAIKIFSVASSIGLLMGQIALFIAGAILAGTPWKTFQAGLYAPVFLFWKGVIDFLCMSGLYQGKNWVRTRRHQS